MWKAYAPAIMAGDDFSDQRLVAVKKPNDLSSSGKSSRVLVTHEFHNYLLPPPPPHTHTHTYSQIYTPTITL